MRGLQSILIFWSFVFGVLFFLAPTFSFACEKISKNSSHHRTSPAKTAKHSRSQNKTVGLSQKRSHHWAHNGSKIIPPSRVRVIDTGSKANSDTFPMPDLISADNASATSSSKKLDRSASVSDDTFENDSFDTLEGP